MPELPEVEVTRRGIVNALSETTIEQFITRTKRLRWELPQANLLIGRKINTVNRRAKYLLVDCSGGTLIIHLGMSGSLRLIKTGLPAQKHEHVDLVLSSGQTLRYRDPRRFGSWLWYEKPISTHPLLCSLGPEPLSEAFNADYFFLKTRTKKGEIKPLLMNQKLVVGVGNIYANEVLFHCKINPQTHASLLTLKQCESLVKQIKITLLSSLEAGGSTLRDFSAADGQPGYFQQTYFVYGRAGLACHKCKMIIQQLRQAQRSSFYCPKCQKIKNING